MANLKRYVIEGDIPGVGGLSEVEPCGASRASNCALEKLGRTVQRQHSCVAADKSFCFYLATGEEAIRKHMELSGIPFTRIIDPLTANN